MKKIHYLYIINFLAAFLLFQIELIISKFLLPKFGGSYLVWSACVVFFQCALLAGYYYSGLVVKKFGIYRYGIFHLVLIAAPLLTFFGPPFQNIAADSRIPLVLDIFLKLGQTIGLAFFVLSTVSIISQSWLAASSLPEEANPYILYSISNLGSFSALLTYPFLFEFYFDLRTQLNIWRLSYLALAAFYLIAFKAIKCLKTTPDNIRAFNPLFFLKQFEFSEAQRGALYWFLLSAAPAMLFLSVTNIITYEIAPCPLFWVIPLCIYLLSFVLTFREKPYCPPWLRGNISLALGFSAGLFFLTQIRIFPFLIYACAYFLLLFFACLFCQYELYLSRPAQKQRLSGFYIIIASGGVFGSILVTWLAPLLFMHSPLEYLFGLLIIPLALVIRGRKPGFRAGELRWIIYMVFLFVLWPQIFKKYNIFGLILFYFILRAAFGKLRERPYLIGISLLSLMFIAGFFPNLWSGRARQVYALRNYYGIYNVSAGGGLVSLYNGTTRHGSQFVAKEKMKEPLSYYHHDTPVGKVMVCDSFNFKQVGIVGLGAGTLAAYGKPGQEMDFFELDPDVYKIATLCFTYLSDSSAKINHIFGDARITLKKMPARKYDLMVIDAFSGDSVPVHLLTVEAIEEYKRCLRPDGIILFHISNRYLQLAPVLFNNAGVVHARAGLGTNVHKDEAYLGSLWVTLTWDKGKADILSTLLPRKKDGADFPDKKIRPWTDAYSNIASVLNIKSLFSQIKNFKIFYW